MKTTVAVYDTKPYDRESLTRVAGADAIDWRFLEFRLGPDTAHAAAGAQAVCVFVNDDAGREVLEQLAGLGVRLLALRCTGFNKVDLPAARELGLPVTRVPNYSPYSVAEHTVALILALNRKIHRAFNRVREHQLLARGARGLRPARQDRRRHRHGQDRADRGRDPEGLRDAGAGLRRVSRPGVGGPARGHLHGPADARARERRADAAHAAHPRDEVRGAPGDPGTDEARGDPRQRQPRASSSTPRP